MLVTVDTAKLVTPELMTRYREQRNDPYTRGMRGALEALGIEPPEPLRRKSIRGRPRGAQPCAATLRKDALLAARQ